MLWKPITSGEEVFLRLYSELSSKIEVHSSHESGLGFLVAESNFAEFTRLVATLEVFMRCVRVARDFYESSSHLPAGNIAKFLRTEADLPAGLHGERRFLELAKDVGRIASTKPRDDRVEALALQGQRLNCYLCGVPLVRTGSGRNRLSIEHLWPQAFGGDTIEENLLPACRDCNSKRQHVITWAWGPVQSTFHASTNSANLPGDLRISLAFARLMFIASGEADGGPKLTLKQAVKRAFPLIPSIQPEPGTHHLYFELLPLARAI